MLKTICIWVVLPLIGPELPNHTTIMHQQQCEKAPVAPVDSIVTLPPPVPLQNDIPGYEDTDKKTWKAHIKKMRDQGFG